jgi:phosphate acyltransferase
MSGDRGPSVCVPAALAAAREFRDVRSRWSAGKRTWSANWAQAPRQRACLHAAEVVEMTDHPRDALRRKKDSSMRRASTWSRRMRRTPASAPATPAR